MGISMRAMVGALITGVLSAGAASAQAVNYITDGFFSGPGTTASGVTCTTTAAAMADCSGAGFTLDFLGTSGVNLADNTIASLGSFSLTGAGNVTVPPSSIFFTLLVNQTTPSLGQAVFLGALSGTVNTTGGTNFSSLIWTPNQFASAGPVDYHLIYDNVGPAAGTGLGIPINNSRGIDALVTVTPEPGTMALVASGLFGLIGIPRRRRGAANT